MSLTPYNGSFNYLPTAAPNWWSSSSASDTLDSTRRSVEHSRGEAKQPNSTQFLNILFYAGGKVEPLVPAQVYSMPNGRILFTRIADIDKQQTRFEHLDSEGFDSYNTDFGASQILSNTFPGKGFVTKSGEVFYVGSLEKGPDSEDDSTYMMAKFQNDQMVWAKSFRGGDNTTRSVVPQAYPSSTGGALTIGTFSNGSGSQCALTHVDAQGSLISARSYFILGNNQEMGQRIATTEAGDSFVLGSTFGLNGYDPLIYKLNPNGDIIWAKTVSANHNGQNGIDGDLFEDQNGNIVVMYNQNDHFCIGTLDGSNGSIISAYTVMGNSSPRNATRISTAYQDAITQEITLTGTIGSDTQGTRMFVARLASDMTLLWARSVGDATSEGTDGIPSADGGVVVGGPMHYSIHGGATIVARLDANGTIPDGCSSITPVSLLMTRVAPVTQKANLTSALLNITEEPLNPSFHNTVPLSQNMTCPHSQSNIGALIGGILGGIGAAVALLGGRVLYDRYHHREGYEPTN